MLLHAYAHVFSWSWTFPLQDPAFPLHPAHGPWRYACTVSSTPKASVWEYTLEERLKTGTKLTVCHNPSTGQGNFLFSQPFVLSPGGPSTSASGYQAHNPGDEANALLRWKSKQMPHDSCGFIKRLTKELAGHIQEQSKDTSHLSSRKAKHWLQSSHFISLYLLLPTHPLSGTK